MSALHRCLPKTKLLLVTIFGIAIKLTAAFSSCIASKKSVTIASRIHPPSSQLHLVPLSKVWDSSASERCEPFSTIVQKLGCKSLDINGALDETSDESVGYKLYLATNIDDLPPITHLTLEVFDATAITLSSTSDWSAFEKAVVGSVVEPAISMYNSYANAVGYIEVLSGLRRRMSHMIEVSENDALSPLVLPDGSMSRLITGKLTNIEEIAAQSSLILVLARDTNDGNVQAAASIELRLQPTDAKIPFSQPWLDSVERKIVHLFPFVHRNNDYSKQPMRPYLCNLCVSENLRRLGIGRALCRLVEAIASQQWGYDHIYLHVDPSNDSARMLYEKEGYKDVGKRWNVMWAGGADGIGYYAKKLR
jgi:ribosomal protein S18 acetylase RimI-like enzyme